MPYLLESPHPPGAALQRSLQRRRQALAVLMIAAVVTLLLAVVASRPGLWGIHLVADVALIGYVALLIHVRNAAAGVEMTHEALGG